jgi:ribosomal protein L22
MAEERRSPTRGQKPQGQEAKRKAPVQKAAAEKEAARQTPAARKSSERKAPARQAAAEEGAKESPARRPAETAQEEPENKADDAAKPRAKAKPKAADRAKRDEPVPVMVRASARYVRVAPRKARLIADQVRGLQIEEARSLLRFSPRGAARDIRKVIDSAASNAENNHELVADEMRIAEITVDEGPTLRRFRARALGRATRINKRTSHIAVALTPEE